jgi:Predicted metal binding domain
VASEQPVLVDPEISRAKLGREIAAWRSNEAEYRSRGWLLLAHDDLTVELGLLGRIPLGNAQVPILLPAIRLDYDNYDLWPPSLTFIDVFSREAADPLLPQALIVGDAGPRNILLRNGEGKVFLCVPGTREFHDHPQHSGEPWPLFRSRRMGSLAVVAERVWQSMTQTIQGVGLQPVLAQQIQIQLPAQQIPPEILQQMLGQAQNAA